MFKIFTTSGNQHGSHTPHLNPEMSDPTTAQSSNKFTLKESLALFVEKHCWSEVLDRLAELADFNAQTADAPDEVSDWQELSKTLEAAIAQAKVLESHFDHLKSDLDHL